MKKRVTRRQARAWLSLMRDCLREMRFTGYAVTIDPRDGCGVRIDYCIEGFLGLISRLCDKLDTSALVTLKNLLAAQQGFSLEQIDPARFIADPAAEAAAKAAAGVRVANRFGVGK